MLMCEHAVNVMYHALMTCACNTKNVFATGIPKPYNTREICKKGSMMLSINGITKHFQESSNMDKISA